MPDLGSVADVDLLSDGDWLLPWLGRMRTLADLRGLDLVEPLKARIGWAGQQRLDQEAPGQFTTPLGRRVPIDYGGADPSIELRLQELFGVTRHPAVGGRPRPVGASAAATWSRRRHGSSTSPRPTSPRP